MHVCTGWLACSASNGRGTGCLLCWCWAAQHCWAEKTCLSLRWLDLLCWEEGFGLVRAAGYAAGCTTRAV